MGFPRSRPPFTGVPRTPGLKVPNGVFFEWFWAIASECPKKCFLSVFWPFWALKALKKTLLGALRGNRAKSLKKHSVGHFQARGPRHSCKWRLGSQGSLAETCIVLQKCALSCRKMRFSWGIWQKTAGNWGFRAQESRTVANFHTSSLGISGIAVLCNKLGRCKQFYAICLGLFRAKLNNVWQF